MTVIVNDEFQSNQTNWPGPSYPTLSTRIQIHRLAVDAESGAGSSDSSGGSSSVGLSQPAIIAICCSLVGALCVFVIAIVIHVVHRRRSAKKNLDKSAKEWKSNGWPQKSRLKNIDEGPQKIDEGDLLLASAVANNNDRVKKGLLAWQHRSFRNPGESTKKKKTSFSEEENNSAQKSEDRKERFLSELDHILKKDNDKKSRENRKGKKQNSVGQQSRAIPEISVGQSSSIDQNGSTDKSVADQGKRIERQSLIGQQSSVGQRSSIGMQSSVGQQSRVPPESGVGQLNSINQSGLNEMADQNKWMGLLNVNLSKSANKTPAKRGPR